jgi:hypothetical protein
MTSTTARLMFLWRRIAFPFLPVSLSVLLLVLHIPWPGWDGAWPSGMARAQAATYEGFGASTPGGSGGAVVRVTNLNDSGPGSLRDAVSQGNRTVVFDVGGTIELADFVYVTGAFMTIDGFTAPAPGITLRGGGLVVRGNQGAHDLIVRGIRIRDAFEDGIQIAYGAYNVVVDHVSIHGSRDGNLDITEGSHDVTVCWSILAGPASGKNMLIKYHADRISLHHNLFVDAATRNPQVATDDAGTPATDITADLRNNVVWNWGLGFGTRVESAAWANAVNNLYASPASSRDDERGALRVCTGECFEDPPGATAVGRLYASGNFSADPFDFAINGAGTEESAFAAASVTTEDTCLAAHRVVAGAGVRPLDALDQQHVGAVALPSCPAVLVKGLYYHALRRVAAEAEVQERLSVLGWTPTIDAVWHAIRKVFDGEEFRSVAVTPSGYVTALYRAALGRDPDSEGLAFYTGEVLTQFNALLPYFVGSPEFATVRGQLTPAALVIRVYRQALGRLPTDAELQRGTDYVMPTADITPGVAALLNSDEFTRAPRTFARHVRILFRALLGREPGADELTSWVDHLVKQLAALGGRPAEIGEFVTRVAQTFRP